LIDSEPLQPISGLISAEHLAQVVAIGGERGVSAGLRDVVSAGLSALNSDAALMLPVAQLEALADRLARVTGRKLPSGAWWAGSDAAMPEPEQLDRHGDTVVSPGRVVLAGEQGALMADAGGRQLAAQDGERHASQPVELAELAGVAGMLTAGLVRLAQTGPGRISLGCGLTLERLEAGPGRVSLHGVGVAASMPALWTFAAELTGLVAGGIAEGIEIRSRLNAQLAEVKS
jgi:hypothetical protein